MSPAYLRTMRTSGFYRRISLFRLDDLRVHQRIISLHPRQRLCGHAPLPVAVAIGGQRGDIDPDEQVQPVQFRSRLPPEVGGIACDVS